LKGEWHKTRHNDGGQAEDGRQRSERAKAKTRGQKTEDRKGKGVLDRINRICWISVKGKDQKTRHNDGGQAEVGKGRASEPQNLEIRKVGT